MGCLGFEGRGSEGTGRVVQTGLGLRGPSALLTALGVDALASSSEFLGARATFVLREDQNLPSPGYPSLAAGLGAAGPLAPRTDLAVDVGYTVPSGQRRTSLDLARHRTLVIGLEIVPVAPAASVRELATLLVVDVVVEALEDGATRSFLLLLHAHLFSLRRVDRAVDSLAALLDVVGVHVAVLEARGEGDAVAGHGALAAGPRAGGPVCPLRHGALGADLLLWLIALQDVGHARFLLDELLVALLPVHVFLVPATAHALGLPAGDRAGGPR